MLPSRGLARAKAGLALHSQILSRAAVRSSPRQAASTRHFGTTLRNTGKPLPRPSSTAGLLSGRGRIGAASLLASQSTFLGFQQARFASDGPTTPPPLPAESTSTSPSDLPSDFSSFPDLDAETLLDIPQKAGYLANLGLDYGWGPSSMCEWVIEHMHFTFGLPWWVSIVGLAVAIRAGMAYPTLVSQQEAARARALRADPMFKAVNDRMMLAFAGGSRVEPTELAEIRMQKSLLYKRNNHKPWKSFLGMLQIPFFIGAMKVTRAMAALPVPGFENGGCLWFQDLAAADPYYVLPVMASIMTYYALKRNLPYLGEQTSMMKMLPPVMGPLTFIFTCSLAASVQVFLISAAFLQILQASILHLPSVRERAGLPPLTEMYGATTSPPSGQTGQYQPPRTITTTAKETTTQKSSMNPIAFFKECYAGAKEKMKDFTDKSDEKSRVREEQDYELRRIQEEMEMYHQRVEEARKKQQQRKDGFR